MALTDALFTGTSGLRALGHGMSVLGDNVANLNTTAFKGARITFSDIMAQSINTSAGSGQLGRGANIQALYQQFTQGAFESTSNPTDMAIAGAGFFMVKNPKSTGGIYYTRDGQFTIDKDGYLVNPQGLRVQGWEIDETTNDITGALTDIRINRTSPPVKTSKIDMITNLDARTDLRTKVVYLKGSVQKDTDCYYDFVVRDIDGNDVKIRIKLHYDSTNQVWTYTVYKSLNGKLADLNNDCEKLAENTSGTSSTQVTVNFAPDNKSLKYFQITLDWSGVSVSDTSTDLNLGEIHTGRIETSDTINTTNYSSVNYADGTWYYKDITIKDENGNNKTIRLFIKENGSNYDYYVFQDPSATPTAGAASPEEDTNNGTLLAKGTNYDISKEGPVTFFLNGSTEKITWDWDSDRTNINGSNDYSYEYYVDDPNSDDATYSYYEVIEMPNLFNAWDARNDTPIASTQYTYRSTLFIYDSLGTPHEVTVYYSPTTKENIWEFLVTCSPSEDQRDFLSDDNPMQWKDISSGTEYSIDSGKTFTQAKKGVLMYGRLEFDNQGNVKRFFDTFRLDANRGNLVKIVDEEGNIVSSPSDGYSAIGSNGYPLIIADFLGISFPYENYPPNSSDQGEVRNDLQQIELNLGYYYKDSWRSESVRTTQYATSNATLFYDQNGFGPGALESISVDNEGRITGIYSNGRVIPLWMVGLANFNAPEKLQRVGGNLFKETTHSGPPITGKPGTNGLGTIAPNSLEQSNVDLGEQFVKMIIFQRGFQADARIITVSDSMLDELINLKR